MRRYGRPLVRTGARRAIAAAVMLLAFAVRAYWTLHVQAPLAAVRGDMAGYVSRADGILNHTQPGDPRVLSFWPWGTHALIAAEFFVFGRHSSTAISLVHAFVGAVAAPCAVLLAARYTSSKGTLLFIGTCVALWHPQIVYSGYFMSEIWFTCANSIAVLFFVRASEARRDKHVIGNGLVAGVAMAIAFVVRPQSILTYVLIAAGVLLLRPRNTAFRHGLGSIVRPAIAIALPIAIAVGISSHRFHRLNGRFGLIASYEPIQRLFGETSVGRLEASWQAPNGDRWTWWFSPPTKAPVAPQDVERMEGFIADPEKIAVIRAKRMQGVGLGMRLRRMRRNLSLLLVDNLTWPENETNHPRWRPELQRLFANITLGLVPIAAGGLLFLKRHPILSVLLLANFATLIVTAAFYLGEVRYRVPYDSFLFVLAAPVLGAIAKKRPP